MNSMSSEGRRIQFLYIIGMIGMLLILLVIVFDREKPEKVNIGREYRDITAMWTLDKEGNQPADVKKLGEYMDPESGVLSLYYQLPEMEKDESLVYRSKDVYTSILVDGEKIYETSVYESKLYNRSPGNLWNVVSVNSKYSSKCLEMQIHMVYDVNALVVDSVFWGNESHIIRDFILDNIFGIITSMLLILLGVVMVVSDLLPTYNKTRKNHSLIWVGVFALLTGIWCLIETNVLQFCFDDMRIFQLMGNILMIIDNVPLLLYFNAQYNIFKHREMRIIGYICTVYIISCVVIQFSGITDMHYMLKGSYIFNRVNEIIIFVWVLRRLIRLKKEREPILNCALQFVGISSLWILGLFETIRTYDADRLDRAGLIRIGMLILCLCLALGNQIETYKVIEQGLKYDFVRELAYSDGLTGLGNRTAYLEQIEAYEKNAGDIERLGIVYLDVNDLKVVNDSFGHEFGDELIRNAAGIIEESFGKDGKSYRIGGDEFCVFMTGENIDEKYKEARRIFDELIKEKSKNTHYVYEIQIAHGFAVCDKLTREDIEKAISDADDEMYENKKYLKGLL